MRGRVLMRLVGALIVTGGSDAVKVPGGRKEDRERSARGSTVIITRRPVDECNFGAVEVSMSHTTFLVHESRSKRLSWSIEI